MEGVPPTAGQRMGVGGEDCAPRTVLALTASDTLNWFLWGKLHRLSELLLLPDEMKMKRLPPTPRQCFKRQGSARPPRRSWWLTTITSVLLKPDGSPQLLPLLPGRLGDCPCLPPLSLSGSPHTQQLQKDPWDPALLSHYCPSC